MQECRFEFDTSYGNDLWIHFSNNQFINRVLEGMLDLPWLYQVKINEKNHFSVVIMMSLFRWFSLFFIVFSLIHAIFFLYILTMGFSVFQWPCLQAASTRQCSIFLRIFVWSSTVSCWVRTPSLPHCWTTLVKFIRPLVNLGELLLWRKNLLEWDTYC